MEILFADKHHAAQGDYGQRFPMNNLIGESPQLENLFCGLLHHQVLFRVERFLSYIQRKEQSNVLDRLSSVYLLTPSNFAHSGL